MQEKTLNIGIIGAGGFAHFAANAFLKVEGIRIVAISDIDETAANEMATLFRSKVYNDYEVLLQSKNIDLVYIATPPFLHYKQSKMALLAGKHVVCEKPAALNVQEAEELVSIALLRKLLYAVNLMQRYNPLFGIVKNIINENLLGKFLHGFFENYASDENLPFSHWFWDQRKSGGIFIEHGVHFFDLFEGWLGEGKVVNAIQLQRPGSEQKIIDRVQATVLYKDGIVNFYHGFDQLKILDRQEMRLEFEFGDITLYEWIPVRMNLHGLFQKKQLERIKELLVNCSIHHHETSEAGKEKEETNSSGSAFDHHVTIGYGSNSEKQNRYGEMLSAMIADQWNWIRDHDHVRVIDSTNAVQSLRVATEAKHKAQKF